MSAKKKCPKCNVNYIQETSLSDVHGKKIYYCRNCQHLWSEEQKFLEYKGKTTVNKLKKSRSKFNYLGKIKTDDVVNIVIDLFIMGGRTFYKKTIFYKKKKI